jgi:AraC-like DNA-binding protein
MPASGSCIFIDADDYQASLQQALDLLVIPPRRFHACLTWVELPNLRLLRAQEASPRIAYVSLPPEPVFVTFATRRDSPLIYSGLELKFGDIMFHSRGERLHQRTTGASRWASISLAPAALMAFGKTIAGEDVCPPPVGRILRPHPEHRLRLLRLHAQAGRIAETNLKHLEHPEVARALEQDLIWALMTCLTTAEPQEVSAVQRDQVRILVQFEEVLAANPCRLLRMPELCSAIGVSEHTLRACCSQVLGMSPVRYQRLRRLKLVRAELLRADPATVSIAEVARRYGFTDLHRFVTEYQNAYGEVPTMTQQRVADR